MKVSDLRKITKEMIDSTEIQIAEDGEILSKVDVKSYIPIKEKVALANYIYSVSLNDDGNSYVVDKVFSDIAFRVYLVDAYTDISLPKYKTESGSMAMNIIESYDLLNKIDVKTGESIYSKVVSVIPQKELEDLNEIIKKTLDEPQRIYEDSLWQILSEFGSSTVNSIKNDKLDK